MSPVRLIPARFIRSRASAHRAMARAALFADSSASVRLRRYSAHMTKARTLEASLAGIRQPINEPGASLAAFTMQEAAQ